MAKKKLGFEGLFDATDPDVTDIDDVIGLCSGRNERVEKWKKYSP